MSYLRSAHVLSTLLVVVVMIGGNGCSGGSSSGGPPPTAAVTGTAGAEQALGERLFLETRFAQAFKAFLNAGGSVNDPNAGDPVVDSVKTLGVPITNEAPFKGLSMNCRSCHFVDDVLVAPGGAMRTYTDFARRSPIPARPDGKTHAPRNSPPLVNSTLDRPGGVLFHFDAEFKSMEDLVAATFTGRNFGWLPGERSQAISHIARVVRGDDGSFDLSDQFGGLSYRILFTGNNAAIADEFRLPPQFRTFIGSGTDQEIFNAVVKVVAAYVNGLLFSQSEDSGAPIRSPFDVFLEINGLPQQPNPNETPIDYSRRFRTLVNGLASPQFVSSNPNRSDGQFQFHSQTFEFGATELACLKMSWQNQRLFLLHQPNWQPARLATAWPVTPPPTSRISSCTILGQLRRNMTTSRAMAQALSSRFPSPLWPREQRMIFQPPSSTPVPANGFVQFPRMA